MVSGGSTFVERHRVVYELPEVAPVPVDAALVLALARYEEAAPVPAEAVVLAGRILAEEVASAPVDAVALRAAVAEVAPVPVDETLLIVVVVPELAPVPAELDTLSTAVAEAAPVPAEAVFLRPTSSTAEVAPLADDAARLGPVVVEVAPAPPADLAEGSVRPFVGANETVNDVGSPTNPANAKGLKDGAVATLADTSAIAAQNKTLRLLYPDFSAFVQTFAITKVELVDFSRWNGALTSAQAGLDWRIGAGAWQALRALTKIDWNDLAAGRAFDITAGIGGSWANVHGVEVRFVLVDKEALGAGTGTLDIDACELRITTADKVL